MSPSLIRSGLVVLTSLLVPVLGFAQTKPTVSWAEIVDALQAEASKVREAVGPWKQVAAIESQYRSGFGSNSPEIPSRPGNANVIAVLDDRRVVIGDADHPVRVFDSKTGELLVSFGERLPDNWTHRHWVKSSSGRLIVMMPNAAPEIWDTIAGKHIATLPLHEDRYLCAAFLPGDRSLVTYAGELDRGAGPDNLQVWDIDEATSQVRLRQTATVEVDARGLELVGPYLLLRGHRSNNVFDAATLEPIFTQSRRVSEEFLALDPPRDNQPGRLITLEYSRGEGSGVWREQEPQFRIIQLPEGREVARWKVPLEEDDGNDHRYQARYALSPARTVFAISQKGRVNFFEFQTGKKLSSVKASNQYDNCSVTFLDEKRAMLGQQRWGRSLDVHAVESGELLESIPESDYIPLVSDDHNVVIASRLMMPVPDQKSYMMLPKPLVVIWRRDDTSGRD